MLSAFLSHVLPALGTHVAVAVYETEHRCHTLDPITNHIVACCVRCMNTEL